jgi:hypothetical protein
LYGDYRGIDMSTTNIMIIAGTVFIFAILMRVLWGAVRRMRKSCAGIGGIEEPRSRIAPVANKAPGLPDGARRAMAR